MIGKQLRFSSLNSIDRTLETHQRTMPMSNAKDAAISAWRPRDGWAFLFAFAVAGSASAARMVDDRLISQANQLHGTALVELIIVTLVFALLLGIAASWLFQKIDRIRDIEEERRSTKAPPPNAHNKTGCADSRLMAYMVRPSFPWQHRPGYRNRASRILWSYAGQQSPSMVRHHAIRGFLGHRELPG